MSRQDASTPANFPRETSRLEIFRGRLPCPSFFLSFSRIRRTDISLSLSVGFRSFLHVCMYLVVNQPIETFMLDARLGSWHWLRRVNYTRMYFQLLFSFYFYFFFFFFLFSDWRCVIQEINSYFRRNVICPSEKLSTIFQILDLALNAGLLVTGRKNVNKLIFILFYIPHFASKIGCKIKLIIVCC